MGIGVCVPVSVMKPEECSLLGKCTWVRGVLVEAVCLSEIQHDQIKCILFGALTYKGEA